MRKSCYTLLIGVLLAGVADGAIIKEGHVLEIIVQGQPAFSGRYTVSKDGTIEYPLLADIPITNLTTSELMNDLTFRLARHIENPLVLVSVVDRPAMDVTVLGHVQQPGPVTTYRGASVQEIIQLAGGPLEIADLHQVKIIHQNDGSHEFFDLARFMREGSLATHPPIQPGDVIILLAREGDDKVKVIGAVSKPGFFELESEINVFELIYLAGGPAEKADLSRVRRFFKNGDKTMEEVIDVQAFIDKGDMDAIPMVNEGDVVIVYSKWFDWKTLLSILNNVLLFIVTIQSIRGAVG
jgi:protein involved in polysaccharide export with SLBB domain